MRTLLVSTLALGAMTSVALATEPAKPAPAQAGPVVLTEAAMDKVTAGHGHLVEVDVTGNNVVVRDNIRVEDVAVCAVVGDCRPRQ